MCGPRALARSIAGYLESQGEPKDHSSGSDLWPVQSALLFAALRAGPSRRCASGVTGLLWAAIYLQRGSPDSYLLGPDLCWREQTPQGARVYAVSRQERSGRPLTGEEKGLIALQVLCDRLQVAYDWRNPTAFLLYWWLVSLPFPVLVSLSLIFPYGRAKEICVVQSTVFFFFSLHLLMCLFFFFCIVNFWGRQQKIQIF